MVRHRKGELDSKIVRHKLAPQRKEESFFVPSFFKAKALDIGRELNLTLEFPTIRSNTV